jgi:hypothetical protein
VSALGAFRSTDGIDQHPTAATAQGAPTGDVAGAGSFRAVGVEHAARTLEPA